MAADLSSPNIWGRDLFALPVDGAVLLASPLRAVSALVNAAALSALRNNGSGASTALRGLREAIAVPAAAPQRRSGPIRPAFLGLIPTRSCNLTCVYCDFGAPGASRERMSIATAVAAVDWIAEIARAAGEKRFEVHFFGGEPLFAGEVIDAAVHRARIVAARLDLMPHLEISTNGVCSESRARFLGDYFDSVVLSLDGPREIHDRHRPMGRRGSFDAVTRTARILSESPVELCLRTCVTEASVGMLEETVRWFCETFQPSMIDVETLQPTRESEAAGLAPPDPFTFAEHFVRARQTARAYGIDAVYASAETNATRNTFCPVGRDTAIVSPDGTLNGCYLLEDHWQRRGLDLRLGHISKEGDVRIDATAVERLRALVAEKPPRCARCFCRAWCAGGCHVNHSYPECPETYDDFCTQTRLITAHALLTQLGADNTAAALFADREAMASLALRGSDRADDFRAEAPP